MVQLAYYENNNSSEEGVNEFNEIFAGRDADIIYFEIDPEENFMKVVLSVNDVEKKCNCKE